MYGCTLNYRSRPMKQQLDVTFAGVVGFHKRCVTFKGFHLALECCWAACCGACPASALPRMHAHACMSAACIMPQRGYLTSAGHCAELEKQAINLSEKGGYRVLVPDLYKGKVGVDKEEAHHLMDNLDWPNAKEEIKAAADHLGKNGKKVGQWHKYLIRTRAHIRSSQLGLDGVIIHRMLGRWAWSASAWAAPWR
jgi:Dienelactone hydrolase family